MRHAVDRHALATAGAGVAAAPAFGQTYYPPPTPPPVPPPIVTVAPPPAPLFTAKLALARASTVGGILDVMMPITSRASGRVAVEYFAAGRRNRSTVRSTPTTRACASAGSSRPPSLGWAPPS